MKRFLSHFLFALFLVLLPVSVTRAHVTRLEINARTDILNGREFGLAGAYEKLVGKVHFAVDPNNAHVDGQTDAPLMDNVRIYYFAGGQHGPGQFPSSKNQTQNLTSPNDYSWSMRALLLALNAWAKDGTPPPANRYAHLADRTLTKAQDVKFPAIPGISFPRTAHEAWRVDYGSQWKTQGIIAYEPPRIGKAFPVMVPQVDADGIDLGGIRLPEVAVPLGTYTGWNPRPSIEERYRQRAHYLKPVQIKPACLQPEKVVLSGVRRFRSRRGATREGGAFWSAATSRRFSLQARILLFRSSIAAERKAATSRRTP
jgi:hypothetical protein